MAPTTRTSLRPVIVGAALALVAVLGAGCVPTGTGGPGEADASDVPGAGASGSEAGPGPGGAEGQPQGEHTVAPTPTSSPTMDEQALQASWQELEPDLTGRVGVAIMAVGGTGEPVVLGDTTEGMAWSTIKVPIAVAALGAQPDSAPIAPLAEASITQSDNDAALSLWRSLGSSGQARETVNASLREAGDPSTEVGVHDELGTTTFGQTSWDVVDQVRYTAGLACQDGTSEVIGHMQEVTPEHAWGLGAIDGVALKGGWGLAQGEYTNRQLAIIPLDGEASPDTPATAVAALVINGEGDGSADLDAIAGWVEEHRDQLPSGRCGEPTP